MKQSIVHKLHVFKLILNYQNSIWKIWNVIKNALGKTKYTQRTFPKKFVPEKKFTDIIVQSFISYVTEIGPNLANRIERSLNFENSMIKCNAKQPEYPLSVNELKSAFFINKSHKQKIILVI